MEIFIGTSGWLYDWNMEGNLEWYVKFSNLNAVELNASFYRFPFRNQVKSWARKGKKLKWAIKVHRSITHYWKLSDRAYDIWTKFYNLFSLMEHLIDFYLFQMPPTFIKTEKNIGKIEKFVLRANLGHKFAIEFRHRSWFNDETVDLCRKLGITLVSIDAPIAKWFICSNKIVYLRMHGREEWYAYDYSYEELKEVADKITSLNPSKIYVFFNNNHWMLKNANLMQKILKSRKDSH